MEPEETRAKLLAWYDANGRDLPWRRTRDPYAIWVSEIMCQQTRVETVVPYYERFMARFPTTSALADASEDDVMSQWSGLGYYRRARLLHAGVKDVVARYGGEVPAEAEDRLGLPGVGRYTAGAIGSIAFDREEPVVDGNVARVLSRHRGIEAPLGSVESTQTLWSHAQALVEGERPGDLNQAVMELGARVCTPRSPRCGECPIARGCIAARGDPTRLPVPKKKKPPTPVWLTAVVATSGSRVWLERGAGTLFGGLWGVPMVASAPPQLELGERTDAPSGRDAAREAMKRAGLRGRIPSARVGVIPHVLSHRRLTVDVWRAKAARGSETEEARFFEEDEMSEIGIATLTRKILAAG